MSDWRQYAACRGGEMHPDTWFPDQGDVATREMALQICHACPVIQQCGQLGFLEAWGIWGGMSQKQRSTLRGIPANVVAQATRVQHFKPCGTPAAYARHYRHGETPCEACRHAYNQHQAERTTR